LKNSLYKVPTLNSAIEANSSCSSGAGSGATIGDTIVVVGAATVVVAATKLVVVVEVSDSFCSLERRMPLSLLSAFRSSANRDAARISSTSTISSMVSCLAEPVL